MVPAKLFPENRKIDDHVASIWLEYQNARDHYQRSLNRCIENWRFYVAVDAEYGYGQWAPDAVAYMSAQGRQILTYNICTPIVDRIAGGIMALPIDPDFIPINGPAKSLTKAIKSAMYSDKELLDWPGVINQICKAGLVFEGVMRMVISDEYHKLGNIGFEYCFPGSVTPDPNWLTWRSKDASVCWHEQYFQPEKMLELWPEARDVVLPYLYRVKAGGHQYGPHEGPTPFISGANEWGTSLKVISQYEMVNRQYRQDWVMTPQGDVPIPRGIKELDDRVHWLNANIPSWNIDHIYETTETEKIQIVNRICPSISWCQTIESKDTEIQIGRLEYFWWSASRDNGVPHGIIDSIKDAQTNINYWESAITNKMQIEGTGGSQFVDRSVFRDDYEFDRYRALRNNPSETFEVKPGMLGNRTPASPTQTSQFPREAYEHLNHLISTMLPHISKVTPVSRGMQETDVKSGYLYKLMTIQSEQQLYTIHFGWRVFWNEVYEAYLMQAANTYSNEHLPRTFAFNQGRETITLNEEVSLQDGSKGIKNDPEQLKYFRHKVIISEKQSSPSQRVEDLKVLGDILPTIPGEMPATKMFIVQRSHELIDSLDEQDKAVLKALGEEELGAAVMALKERRLNSEINIILLEQKLNQIKLQTEQPQQVRGLPVVPPAGQPSKTPLQIENSSPEQGFANITEEPQPQAGGSPLSQEEPQAPGGTL